MARYTLYPARSFSLLAFQLSVAEELDGAFSVRVTVAVLVTLPLVMVMMAALFPGLALAVFMFAVIVPLFDPDVGLSDNQGALSLAVHVPVALNVIACGDGFAAP